MTRTLSAFVGTIGNLVKASRTCYSKPLKGWVARNMWIFVRTMGPATPDIA